MTPAPERLAVILPTWLGDCMMATPLLRALRKGLPGTSIVAVVGRGNAVVMEGLASVDEVVPIDKSSWLRSAATLKSTGCDAVLLLPNAFRWAAVARLAGVPRRIGYARDGRSWLLTDGVKPVMTGRWPRRTHAIVPAIRHYLGLLTAFRLEPDGRRMDLAVTPNDDKAADAVFISGGIGDERLALFVPGGRYGSAKLWPTKHFADLSHKLVADRFRVLVSTAPGEEAVAEAIAADGDVTLLANHGLSLSAVKAIVGRCDLVVSNDTGARHLAVAAGTPTVTVFGPTDPQRTTLNAPREVEVFLDLDCQPCQQKLCPLPEPQTQRCLRDLSPQTVHEAALRLLKVEA
ncbi:MAG: lipopolysaccharide heptosyltransferase II [Planctomycetota bacterium]